MSKENDNKEKTLQEKFIEFQVVQQQTAQVQQQLQQIAMQKDEIGQIIQNLNDLHEVKKGSEILAPVTSGIFAKAVLQENDSLFINVGKGVVVKKTVGEAKQMMQDQENEIRKVEQSLNSNLQKLAEKSAAVEEELQALLKEAKEYV